MTAGKFSSGKAAMVQLESIKISAWEKTQIYLNTLNHMFIATVTIYITWLSFQMGFERSRTLHVWLCTLGYQLLMCESIMSLYKNNSWSIPHGKRTKTNLHWILQAIGSSMAIAGMIIEYQHRGRHFTSTHSRLGLASGVFTVLGVLNGTSALWSRELYRFVKPVYSKIFHNVTGISAFVLGMASLVYGFEKGTIYRIASWNIARSLQVLCVITIVLSLVGGFKSFIRLLSGSFPRVSERIMEKREKSKSNI